MVQQIAENFEPALLKRLNSLRTKPVTAVQTVTEITNFEGINAYVKSQVKKGELHVNLYVTRGLIESLFTEALASDDVGQFELSTLRLRGIIAHEMAHPIDNSASKPIH